TQFYLTYSPISNPLNPSSYFVFVSVCTNLPQMQNNQISNSFLVLSGRRCQFMLNFSTFEVDKFGMGFIQILFFM
ncbi:MAG TPA: hypothetical protein VK872_12450, partial [Draconibacterium sp.]|nr:hypothetical protein [Draconibacterium sp.]